MSGSQLEPLLIRHKVMDAMHRAAFIELVNANGRNRNRIDMQQRS